MKFGFNQKTSLGYLKKHAKIYNCNRKAKLHCWRKKISAITALRQMLVSIWICQKQAPFLWASCFGNVRPGGILAALSVSSCLCWIAAINSSIFLKPAFFQRKGEQQTWLWHPQSALPDLFETHTSPFVVSRKKIPICK